jgi:hypothetical protein
LIEAAREAVDCSARMRSASVFLLSCVLSPFSAVTSLRAGLALNPGAQGGARGQDDCPQFVRTILVLPRSKRNPDDVEEHCENHIYDAARYALMADRTPGVSFRRRQVW